MAIPPEQRDRAVHAFVTSVQLMEAADGLLPLTADGQPALPADTLAGQEAEVQAMLLAATAFYISPGAVQWEGSAEDRLDKYMERRCHPAGSDLAYRAVLSPLSGLLLDHCYVVGADPVLTQPLFDQQLELLQSARNTLSQQLQQVQCSRGHQLLTTADQLEAAIHLQNLQHIMLRRRACPGFVTVQQHQVPGFTAATAASCQRLLALDPNNPKALMTASHFVQPFSSLPQLQPAKTPHEAAQRALDLFLQAFRAAQAMRSQYWEVTAASSAVALAVKPGISVSHADMAALLAAVEGAPAAVRQLVRVLPQQWTTGLQLHAQAAAAFLPAAQLRGQGGELTGSQAHAASSSLRKMVAQLDGQDKRCVCSGCGVRALDLRRCAHCKQAACEQGGGCSVLSTVGEILVTAGVSHTALHVPPYATQDASCALPPCADCSRECQVRHWLQHKRECKAPGGSGGSRA